MNNDSRNMAARCAMLLVDHINDIRRELEKQVRPASNASVG